MAFNAPKTAKTPQKYNFSKNRFTALKFSKTMFSKIILYKKEKVSNFFSKQIEKAPACQF
jgi:hypothetical protein